jgi:hypothetical protein
MKHCRRTPSNAGAQFSVEGTGKDFRPDRTTDADNTQYMRGLDTVAVFQSALPRINVGWALLWPAFFALLALVRNEW